MKPIYLATVFPWGSLPRELRWSAPCGPNQVGCWIKAGSLIKWLVGSPKAFVWTWFLKRWWSSQTSEYGKPPYSWDCWTVGPPNSTRANLPDSKDASGFPRAHDQSWPCWVFEIQWDQDTGLGLLCTRAALNLTEGPSRPTFCSHSGQQI